MGELIAISKLKGLSSPSILKRPLILDLLKISELASLYNQGVPSSSVLGTKDYDKYRWLIADFGLAEPNGKRPKELLKIDLGLPDEK